LACQVYAEYFRQGYAQLIFLGLQGGKVNQRLSV